MKKLLLSTLFACNLFSTAEASKDKYILVRNPIDAMEEMFDYYSDEAEKIWNSSGMSFVSNRGPAINIIDEGKDFVVEVQVPGFKKEQIEVKIESKSLKVSAKKEEKKEEATKKYLKSKAFVSSFIKEISLPGEVVVDKATSTLQDGILKIILPKKEAKSESKIVEIKES